MEIYKYIQLDNDDILLEKIILDTTQYTIINKDNGDIILKKNNYIDIKNIKDYDYKKSILLECSINNIEFNKLKYKSIIEHIYYIINDGTKIIKNTKLNIKTIIKEDEGFKYLANIGISIQGADSNKSLYEIINQCCENDIKLFMKIKLINELIINIKI